MKSTKVRAVCVSTHMRVCFLSFFAHFVCVSTHMRVCFLCVSTHMRVCSLCVCVCVCLHTCVSAFVCVSHRHQRTKDYPLLHVSPFSIVSFAVAVKIKGCVPFPWITKDLSLLNVSPPPSEKKAFLFELILIFAFSLKSN